mmetsp:Transcript_7395/g.20269  ORF Transcript_7395/g.20269 Transcript_7395/m.20269 type:complete len:218 (+) Transcript_7395:1122-1775(+)
MVRVSGLRTIASSRTLTHSTSRSCRNRAQINWTVQRDTLTVLAMPSGTVGTLRLLQRITGCSCKSRSPYPSHIPMPSPSSLIKSSARPLRSISTRQRSMATTGCRKYEMRKVGVFSCGSTSIVVCCCLQRTCQAHGGFGRTCRPLLAAIRWCQHVMRPFRDACRYSATCRKHWSGSQNSPASSCELCTGTKRTTIFILVRQLWTCRRGGRLPKKTIP